MQGTHFEDIIWISFGERDGHTLYPVEVRGPARKGEPGSMLCRIDTAAEGMETFAGPGSAFLEERDAVVYFNGPGGFLQQPVRICAHDDDHESGIVRIEPRGIAAIAEDRVTARVGVAIPECTAVVGGDDVCQIADASVRGLSVVSSEVYEHGQTVDVAFEVGSGVYAGKCRVRSIAPVRDRTRYGMVAVRGGQGGTLEAGLADLTAAVARLHRRPISKAG